MDEWEEDSEMNTIPLRYLWSCLARKGNSDLHTVREYHMIMLQWIMCNEWVQANTSVLF